VSLTLPSFAKVNLDLRVLGKRGDGYHDIFTIFQTISLHDTVTFDVADELSLECEDPDVPTDGSNLILRAAGRLRASFGISQGTRIRLEKSIPMGGGLGGGSSNAAVTLIGLSKLWGIDAQQPQLKLIAAELGSDVPFFLEGGTAAGSGRGTEIEPLSDFRAEYMLIVTPSVHVSTASAYAGLQAESLTNVESNRILRVCRSEAKSMDFVRLEAVNDFERSVFAEYPEVGRVKRRLIELGANRVMMSGSGASVFAVFDKEETRRAALKALDDEVNWRKFAVAAVSRDEYRTRMLGKS
jgi:4-diphosphocytidyl-2-C-methyl-D-erythritol kinase